LFHRYYNLHHVVVDDDETTKVRIALVTMTQRVIKNGLTILGVNAPEKM
jgi:arginyl-tRNA synthetase